MEGVEGVEGVSVKGESKKGAAVFVVAFLSRVNWTAIYASVGIMQY